jgi:hypothetical protein
MKAIHDIGAALFNRHPPRFSTGLYTPDPALTLTQNLDQFLGVRP